MQIPTAALISTVALLYLWFFTAHWSGLLIFAGATMGCIIIFGSWVAVTMRRRWTDKSTRLRTSDYAKLALFISLLTAVDFSLHYIPGWIWRLIPFASAILYYLPAAAIAVSAIRTVSKPGAALLLLLGYAVISQIISPFLAWLPYHVVWAILFETYFSTVNDYAESMGSAVLGGWVFGLVSTSFNPIFNWATLQWWTPLFLSIPKAFVCASASAVGAVLGSRIGEKAGKISL